MSRVSGENAATTSYSASSSGRIAYGAAVVITERLAELPDLALPSSLYKDTACAPATADILAYLQALLEKDPAAFLARYGGVLQSQELNHFEALRSADFEVDHWLGYFAAQRMAAADQAANPRRLPARVKNRRLAAMRRLAAQGEYFSDEAMRHRAPLLYHQHIGCFDEQPQQQQAVAPAVVAGAAAARSQQEDRQGQERSAGCRGAPAASSVGHSSGGLGGSCLAAALQQALRTRDGTLPAASAAAAQAEGDPGCATRVLPTIAIRHVPESRSEERPPPAEPPQPTGPSRAAVGGAYASGDNGTDMVMEMEDVPGPSARAAAGALVVDSSGGGSGQTAGRSDLLFSEFLMRQDDEAQLVMRRMQEQQEEDAQMSEHDSDDDEGDEENEQPEGDGGKQGGQQGAGAPPSRGCSRRGQPSASERAQMRRDFMSEMQSRFLLGQDGQYVDYGAIDADASLDGDWLEEESRDAEEKYFDED